MVSVERKYSTQTALLLVLKKAKSNGRIYSLKKKYSLKLLDSWRELKSFPSLFLIKAVSHLASLGVHETK